MLWLQKSISSGLVGGTAEASLDPCEWGRRAVSAQGLGWSAGKERKQAQILLQAKDV